MDLNIWVVTFVILMIRLLSAYKKLMKIVKLGAKVHDIYDKKDIDGEQF